MSILLRVANSLPNRVEIAYPQLVRRSPKPRVPTIAENQRQSQAAPAYVLRLVVKDEVVTSRCASIRVFPAILLIREEPIAELAIFKRSYVMRYHGLVQGLLKCTLH